MNELLSVKNLSVTFTRKRGWRKPIEHIHAVRSVSFQVAQGEIFGLVGESGCGKTTLSRAVIGVQPRTAGEVIYDGQPIAHRMHPRQVQLVFQDPYASLNPRLPVRDALMEPLIVHESISREARLARVLDVMDRTGLSRNALTKYPHEFSGGQRQRIVIARALMLKPALLIADEPVSALDVSVQAMVLNLLLDLRRDLNLAMIFVSHDLAVVKHMADQIAVMKAGEFVEVGAAADVMSSPQHPYTQELLSCVPKLSAR